VCQMLTIPHEASHKTGESSYLQEESREARKVPWSSLQFLVSTAELSAEQVVYTHYVRMPSSMAFARASQVRHKQDNQDAAQDQCVTSTNHSTTIRIESIGSAAMHAGHPAAAEQLKSIEPILEMFAGRGHCLLTTDSAEAVLVAAR